MNEKQYEMVFLRKVIQKQKEYRKHLRASIETTEKEKDLKYLKATLEEVERDIKIKEMQLQKMREEVAKCPE